MVGGWFDAYEKKCILLFEQLFIYTMIEAGQADSQTDGVIGSNNGSKRLKKYNDPVISWKPDQAPGTILVSEISLGYYGRYKTPLVNMGIIDSKDNTKMQSVDPKSLYGKYYLEVEKSFISFLKKKKYRFSDFDKKGRRALKECVCGSFRPGESKFWIDKINSDNLNDHKHDLLMDKCQRIINRYDKNKEAAKSFYNDLYKETKSSDVENVLNIEPFLVCLEYVFYNLLNSRSVSDVKLPNEKYFKACLAKAKNVRIEGTDPLKRRFDKLFKECSSYNDLAQGVLNYHKFVCEQKGASFWAEIGTDGFIHTFVHEASLPDYRSWRRDYYYYAYKDIIRGIKEIELRK